MSTIERARPGAAPVAPITPFVATIGRLAPITLADLEATAGLTTRVDRKYLVPPAALAALVRSVGDRAVVLEIRGVRRFRYRSLYFDTPDLAAFRGAALGRRRRFKVRTRRYDDSGQCALEVKTAGARGETVKERLPYDGRAYHRITAEGRAFVDGHTGYPGLGARLGPVVLTRYLRTTLVDQCDGARVTVDEALLCADGAGRRAVLRGLAVVETKSPGSATAADRWLWAHGFRPQKLSKFGVGMALFDPALPANRWNRVLRRHFDWVPAPVVAARPGAERQEGTECPAGPRRPFEG